MATYGDIFDGHNEGGGLLPASSEYRTGMLPNILQRTGQFPTTKNYLVQSVNSAETEKPCVRFIALEVLT